LTVVQKASNKFEAR